MLAEIIMKLRRSRHTRPIFGDRVAGSANPDRIPTYEAMAYPAAVVCFLDESAETQPPGANANRQRVTQRWGVVVMLQATNDIRAQDPAQQIEAVRAAICRAIYNWSPNYNPDPYTRVEYRYGNLWYDGCQYVRSDRAQAIWLLTFGTYFWLCEEEGETEDQFEPLPDYDGVNINIDWRKPHDPGLPPSEEYDPRRGPAPWPTGPEGRIEQEIRYQQVSDENPRRRH